MIVDILSLVVSTCVLNQSCGHWLLSDALNVFMSMVFEFQANIIIHAIPENMVDDDMSGYDVGKIGCEYQKTSHYYRPGYNTYIRASYWRPSTEHTIQDQL